MRIEICARVQGTPIVPQDEVAGPPDMLIYKPPLFLVVEQGLEQPIALGAGHVQDVVRHEPVHEQSFASGIRVCSHDGMRIMRHALTDR